MTLYSSILFLHVLGALTLFIAFGLEWTGLGGLRRATTLDVVRAWLQVLAKLRFVYLSALALILIPGIYMAEVGWGWPAWVVGALIAVIILSIVGMTVTKSGMMAIGQALASETETVSPELRARLHNSTLWMSVHLRLGIAVGIVFLMTVRPGLVGVLVAFGVAVVVGFGLGIRSRGEPHTEAG